MKWDDSPSPTPRSLGPSRGSPVSPAQKSGISPFSPPIVEVESPVKKYIIAKSKSTNSLLKGKANQSMAKNRSDVMAKNKSDVSAEDNVPKMVKANKMGKNMKSGWEDSTVSGTRRTPGLSARSQRHSSAESEAKTTQENRLKPTTSTSAKVISPSALILTPNIQKFKEVKSKRYEFNRYDLEMNTPGGRKSRVRRGEKLTSFVVDEDTILRTQGEDGIWQDGSKLSLQSKEKSFLSEGGKSVIDRYDTSGQNTMYAEMPATPGYSSENSELGFSRGVSMITIKSAGQKSNNSRYNARMELLDRGGASVMPTDRYEMPTPLSDIDNDAFMLDGYTLKEVDEDNEDGSPFMKDPLALFDDDDYDDDEDVGGLERGLSNLSGRDVLKSRENLISRDTARTRDSFEGMRLKERTATELSQVGPLPKFLARDNTARNFDDVSTDSAIESAISISEYATSHFSEKMTLSHLEQQSSQQSQVSEENNMFDVDQVSNLEYEGDFYDTDTNKNFEEIYRMKHELDIAHLHMHGLDYQANQNNLNNSGILNSVRPTVLENNYVLGLDTITSMAEERSESTDDDEEVEPESGKISVDTSQASTGYGWILHHFRQIFIKSNHNTPGSFESVEFNLPYTLPRIGSAPGSSTPSNPFKPHPLETPKHWKTLTPGHMVRAQMEDRMSAMTRKTAASKMSVATTKRLYFGVVMETPEEMMVSKKTLVAKESNGSMDTEDKMSRAEIQFGTPTDSAKDTKVAENSPTLENLNVTGPAIASLEDEEPVHVNEDFVKITEDNVNTLEAEINSPRFTPKDPLMYHYYDNRQAAQGAQYSKPRQDRLSGYDSGISKDMSEFSQGRAVRQDWRKFFEMVPYAAERRQMEQIRREMIQGKLKPSTLPPISYFAENLPMLPGEAGTRLLQTVRVGEKMQWTTGVPTLKDHTQPPQRIPKHRNQGMIHALHEQTRADRPDSEQELHFPHLKGASPSLTNQIAGNQYEWEFPLPPPPAKDSRTNNPSQGKEKTKHLPEVFVKRLREGDQGQQGSRTRSPGKQKSLTKTDLGSTLFPPIKLGQIVNIY
ncbi:hypothetical protein MAR_035059 [Mya arenaria]|uniref:Uncharacterized protein n=1 Tax=Mya arenaria TaxID=6604 RepID=A0ABY7EMX8_MYAAR|nr:hypothetical protein MAR_035059 [Mya arenaria]